jgi:hypothetical protein
MLDPHLLVLLQMEHLLFSLTAYSGSIDENPSWWWEIFVESSLEHAMGFDSCR